MPDKNITRRNVLKCAGAATAGLAAATGTASASDDLVVRIHERENVFSWRLDQIKDALEVFMDDLVAWGAIDSYDLEIEDETLYDRYHGEYVDECSGLTCDISQDENCEIQWASEAAEGIRDDWDQDGNLHLFVTSESNFANPVGGYSVWEDGIGFAWVGTAGGYDDTNYPVGRYKNLAIQELGHVLINADHIDEPAGWDDADKEHALGMLYPANGFDEPGPVTPMATFYEEDGENPCSTMREAAGYGDCNADIEWNERHRQHVTTCTRRAIEETNDKDGF